MKKLNCLALLLITFLTACGTLNKDGIYKGDKVLYAADKTIVSAYDGLHTFVKWEFEHREALRQWPEVKESADVVRKNAQAWIETSTRLRDAYTANPSELNKTTLQKSLDVLNQALLEISIHMSKPIQGGK